MSDLLLDLSKNPQARRLVKSLGLPIPMPQALRRATGPWRERPLENQDIVVGAISVGAVTRVLGRTLAESGANALVAGDPQLLTALPESTEERGRSVRRLSLEKPPNDLHVSALVFDGTAIENPEGLGALYDFFHPLVGSLTKCSRVVVVGPEVTSNTPPSRAAAAAALEGFTRSLAKEVGKNGGTAQLLTIEAGAETRLPPVLRFFLSERSAFITGQPIAITTTVRTAGNHPSIRPLHGKIALVTGAARGIGAATAEQLAAEGAHVVCLDRPADDGPASQVARAVGGSLLLCDISQPDSPRVICDHLQQRHGGVDIVVHNAGVTRDKTLRKMKRELWDQAIDINLGAVVRITDELLHPQRGVMRDHGRIVCLSSVAGIAGNVGQTNYAASKAGIMGFVRRLAPAVAERGIAVNAIAPGFIETRLTNAMPLMIREGARRMSALGQGGLPQDVAEAIVFLSSPGAEGITGSVLRVCGGALVGA